MTVIVHARVKHFRCSPYCVVLCCVVLYCVVLCCVCFAIL